MSKVGCNRLEVLLSLRGFRVFCFGLFQAGKAAGNCRAWLRTRGRDLLQQSLGVSDGQKMGEGLYMLGRREEKPVFSKNEDVRNVGFKEMVKAGLGLELNPHFLDGSGALLPRAVPRPCGV